MGREIERIVVMLPTWVGDAVMATPALAALRRSFSDARITWMGSPAARQTLAGLDLADEVVGDASRSRRLPDILGAIRFLRAGRFDLAVLMPNNFRSAAVCRLGRVGRRIGYDRECRGRLLTEALPVPRDENGRRRPVPAIEYYLQLARAAGCEATDRTMSLTVQAADAAQAERLLAAAGGAGPVVVINPGASFGSSKLWPTERFAAVADALRDQYNARIILHAGPREGAIAAAVADAMAVEPLLDFSRRAGSLGLLKALTARAALVITGDTGPRHIAAALGTPVVTIFGPTDPAWTTLDFPHERIVRAEVDCSPCQKKRCPLPAGDAYHQCMRKITPEMVLDACRSVLESADLARHATDGGSRD